MPARERLGSFAATGATLAIHLSIHVLNDVVAELTPHYGAECPVAIIYRASWPDQRVIRGTLASIAAKTGTTVARLEQLNPGIDPTALRVGDTIRVQ